MSLETSYFTSGNSTPVYTSGDPKYFQVWVGFAVGPSCRTSGLAVWTTWSSKPYNIGGICGGTCLWLKLPKWRCLAPLPHACMLSHFGCVWLFVTLWTIAHQAPLSTGFSRQEYWSGFPYPPPEHFPDPGIKPLSLSSALAGKSFATSATWKAKFLIT